jgi:hypothetical protein
MPLVANEKGCKVWVHVRNEHPPPHVHVYYDDTVVKIKLDDLTIIDNINFKPPRKVFDVVRKHRVKAWQLWEEYVEKRGQR